MSPKGPLFMILDSECWMSIRRFRAAAFRDARDNRGQRYHRAVRGLAARWTRILWRCCTDRTTYDPALHRSALAATRTA
jgi:hypothetical protein